MSTKRFFQTLDELNAIDERSGSRTVQISNSLVAAKTAPGGGEVSMGVPSDVLYQITLNGQDVVCMLLVIDKKAFEKVSKLPPVPKKNAQQVFEEAVRPLIKYLAENGHPHVTAIVTPTGAELVEGKMSTGNISDYIKS